MAFWHPVCAPEIAPSPQEKISRLEAELDEERSTVELLTERVNRGRDQVSPALPLSCVHPRLQSLMALSGHLHPPVFHRLEDSGRRVHSWLALLEVPSASGRVERSQGVEWKKKSRWPGITLWPESRLTAILKGC